ncbi:MAG: type II toxin-antitoxin system PemK/MazF family toxin [Planctomycetes bacterium]|nr:type II toxin-antitoxin system PemK/MazF family toxin [Planctomycetota bacterium]
MTPSELYLAKFPFGGKIGAKIRPVLVLTGYVGTVPEVLVAYVTSIVPNPLLPTDIVIDPADPEHVGTKLKQVSVVRVHKLATLHKSDFARFVGKLSPNTWSEVETKLRLLLNL